MVQNVKKYLLSRYQDVKFAGSFSGVDKFYRAIKAEGKRNISKKRIKQFLQSQEYYTLQRQVNRKFKRNKVITPYAGYQIDIDTAFLTQYSKNNDGYSYVLAGIDCFSKLAHTEPLKSLKANEMEKALERLLSKFKNVYCARFDKGKEFNNRTIKNLLDRLTIKYFYTENTETKANFIERFFKTFKNLLFRYMSSQKTHRWIENLQHLTNSYNNSFHSSIKQAPNSVKKSDEYKIWKLLYEKELPIPGKRFSLNLHDIVRLSTIRSPFERSFDELWTREYFIIADRSMKESTAIYKLKDTLNEMVNGAFYENELQKIDISDISQSFIIEKVLKKTRAKSLVQWLGWPVKFASWIRNSELENFSQ